MNAKQFLSRAAKDGYQWDVNALVSLAVVEGLNFTHDQLATAADELWGDLSEDQLRGVVGGKKDDGDGPGGNPNPPPGHLPDGEYWSPPPGDVSGNSCFFMRPR